MTGQLLFIGAFPRPAAIARYVSGDLALHLRARGYPFLLTSTARYSLMRVAGILRRILSQPGNYDLACVDVFSGKAFLWAELACKALRVVRRPYILTLHGGQLPEFSTQHPSRVERLLRSAVAVTSPSPYLAAKLAGFRSDIRVIPNGLDISDYTHRFPRRQLTNLIWLRAFHTIYNPTMAVQVLHALNGATPSTTLSMVGPDKNDGSLKACHELAARLCPGLVHFPGPVAKEQVPSVLQQGDIFLNTTNIDNTPVSVLEAMACGLPVVSTNVGGLPYLLQDGESALLVPPDSPDAMAQAVRELCSSPELARNLSLNGRRLVEQFDWAVVLPKWEALFQEVLQRP